MNDFQPNDEKFDKGTGWTEFYRDSRFVQRYLVEGKRFFSETLMEVRCGKDAAVAMLQGSWTWWDNGKMLEFHKNPDMSCDMDLKPISWGPTIVHQHLLPPTELTNPKGIRLPALVSHHFLGSATFDVYDKPQGGGLIVVRGRFHGVESRIPIPFASTLMATKIHLRAESGTLSFPFPRGTGWVGLYRRLEGAAT